MKSDSIAHRVSSLSPDHGRDAPVFRGRPPLAPFARAAAALAGEVACPALRAM